MQQQVVDILTTHYTVYWYKDTIFMRLINHLTYLWPAVISIYIKIVIENKPLP